MRCLRFFGTPVVRLLVLEPCDATWLDTVSSRLESPSSYVLPRSLWMRCVAGEVFASWRNVETCTVVVARCRVNALALSAWDALLQCGTCARFRTGSKCLSEALRLRSYTVWTSEVCALKALLLCHGRLGHLFWPSFLPLGA